MNEESKSDDPHTSSGGGRQTLRKYSSNASGSGRQVQRRSSSKQDPEASPQAATTTSPTPPMPVNMTSLSGEPSPKAAASRGGGGGGLSRRIRAISAGFENRDFVQDLTPPMPTVPWFLQSCCNTTFMRWISYVFVESIWVFLALLGIISAILDWSVTNFVYSLLSWRVDLTSFGGSDIGNYIIWAIFSVFTCYLSYLFTSVISPISVGSGIPEVKSIMTGFSIPGFLAPKTLFAKYIGLCLALGSGLQIGKEGPFVHMSCIIALLLLRLPMFQQIRNSRSLTKHVLAAASAVGVSSNLGAPVGGVLFSIEVTNTIYQTTHHAKGFFCSVCGALAFRAINTMRDYIKLEIGFNRQVVSLYTTHFDPQPYTAYEVPLFVLVAVICGFSGGMFNRLYLLLIRIQRVMEKRRFIGVFFRPAGYTVMVALITCTIFFPRGDVANYDPYRSFYPGGSFMEYDVRRATNELFTETEMRFVDNGMTWVVPDLIFNLLIFFIVRAVLTALAISAPIPCGIFSPSMLMGATLGRLCGEISRSILGPSIVAGGYAVVGASAFTAGLTGSVSTAVIVFELTSQMSFMLPILLAVTIGRAAGRMVCYDLYTCMGMTKKLPALPELNFQKSHGKFVRDVMQENFVSVPRFCTLEQLRDIIRYRPPYLVTRADSISESESSAPPGSTTNNISAAVAVGATAVVVDSSETPRKGPQDDDVGGEPNFVNNYDDPSFTYPVVDAAGLYLGAVRKDDLVNAKRRAKQKYAKVGVRPEDMGNELIDITKECHSDGMSMNLPWNCVLGDAIVLFEVHKNNVFFITNHRRVIGRLDLDHLGRMCDRVQL